MAEFYDINLSNGTILAKLRKNEVSGPNNISNKINIIEWQADAIVVEGKVDNRFIAGFQFNVYQSQDDGTYTVDAAGSSYNPNAVPKATTIKVTANGMTAQVGSNIGYLQYSIHEANTTLKLPGKEISGYGELIVENLVHMTENWAADVSPDTNAYVGLTPKGDPLKGQLWFKTLNGQEGFQFYNGTEWTNHFDFDDGSLVLRDNSRNRDIHVSASPESIPGFDPAHDAEGLTIWPTTASSPTGSILTVRSHSGTALLTVEDRSNPYTGFIKTAGNLETLGTGRSTMRGSLSIGGGNVPTHHARTLTVEGSGLTVYSQNWAVSEMNSDTPSQFGTALDMKNAGQLRGYLNMSYNDFVARWMTTDANDNSKTPSMAIAVGGCHTTAPANAVAGNLSLTSGMNKSTNNDTRSGYLVLKASDTNLAQIDQRYNHFGGEAQVIAGWGNVGGNVYLRAGDGILGQNNADNWCRGGNIEIYGGNANGGNNKGGDVNIGTGIGSGSQVEAGSVNIWRGTLHLRGNTRLITDTKGTQMAPAVSFNGGGSGMYYNELGPKKGTAIACDGTPIVNMSGRGAITVSPVYYDRSGAATANHSYEAHVLDFDDLVTKRYIDLVERHTGPQVLRALNHNASTYVIDWSHLPVFQGFNNATSTNSMGPQNWWYYAGKLQVFVDGILWDRADVADHANRQYSESTTAANRVVDFGGVVNRVTIWVYSSAEL